MVLATYLLIETYISAYQWKTNILMVFQRKYFFLGITRTCFRSHKSRTPIQILITTYIISNELEERELIVRCK